MDLQSRIPTGPLEGKWERHRFEMKLVNPANKRKYTILVVGSGLAGASAAATLSELGYNVKYVGRDASASPATGSRQVHLREQKELVRAALNAQGPYYVSSYNPRDQFGSNGAADEAARATVQKTTAPDTGAATAKG